MKPWIKIMAVTLPLAAAVGYWALQHQEGELVGQARQLPAIATVEDSEASGETPSLTEASVVGTIERLPENDLAVNHNILNENAVAPPLIALPAHLDQSDSSVLAVAAELSPLLAQWLLPEEQIRKWVLAVDLLADGKMPQRHRPVDYTVAPFKVIAEQGATEEDRFVSVDRNSERFTPLINAVVDIEPRTLGRYYQAWLPIFEQAYAELGKKGAFQARVSLAADNMLRVGAMPGRGVLQQPHVLYEFESDHLEQRSPLEKALWRIGDSNREVLQAYLKELKFYL
jgi:Protein of unknown function (DUF3014)